MISHLCEPFAALSRRTLGRYSLLPLELCGSGSLPSVYTNNHPRFRADPYHPFSLPEYLSLTNMDTIGLLVIASIPTVIGVSQALRFKEQAAEQEKQGPKWFNLACVPPDQNDELYGAKIVLVDKKLLIDTKPENGAFPFKGLFHDYLGTEVTGLVSHIGSDPPALNWIYIEDEICKYGTGSESKGDGKETGPFSYKGGVHLNDKALFYVGEQVGDGRWQLMFGDKGKGKRVQLAMLTLQDEK